MTKIPDSDTEALHAENPEALLADNFEEAFIGYGGQYAKHPLAIYDITKCIEVLVKGGMSEDAAEEFLSFNVLGAWMGEGTPIFMTPRSDD